MWLLRAPRLIGTAALASALSVVPVASAAAPGSARPREAAAITALAAASAPDPPPPQETAPKFVERVDVSLVLVPVVVRDATGRPVTDLKREEFTVTEEGVPQALAAFGLEKRPVSIMLALDTSASMRPHDLAVKRAALDFVRAQSGGITFALQAFSDGVYLERDFTENRKEIESAIAATRAEGEDTALYDAVAAAVRHLEKREDARVAVLFTDGADTKYPMDQAEARLDSVIGDAARRDVTVYTVAFGARAASWILEKISGETGGEPFSAATEKDLPEAFAHIAESVGSRYLLGYRPPVNGGPAYRKIDVKVARTGLRVAARHGYYPR